jgi:dolichol-phosphate mannosyltransferase
VIKIIIPVLNEKKNLPKLIDEIEAALSGKYQIILVDDGSTDGTLQTAREIAKIGPIIVYERKKTSRGSERGAALQFGLIKSLETPGDVFVEMDGDLSHQPADLLPALDILKKGEADMVIGSKFHSSSKISGRHWSRRLISVFASFITGMVIDSHIRDWSNGLRAYNRSVALRISRLCSLYRGPSFLPESLAAILNEGFRVEELPSYYKDRQEGKSKLSSGNVVKALAAVLEIGIRYHLTGFKFHENNDKRIVIASAQLFQRRKNSFVEKAMSFGMAAVVGIQLFVLPDHMGVDPLGLSNPIFQFIKTGEMTYPIHGYEKSMIVHPPFFYYMVSFLVIIGVPLKFAISLPAFIVFIIILKVFASSPYLKFWEKIFFPLCIPAAVALVGPTAADLRPDLTAFVFLAAGALLFFVASREQWVIQKLFFGTLLFTIGSSLHYVYIPSILGLIVPYYFICRNNSKNRLPQLAMLAGLTLSGLALVAIFYLPNAKEIFEFLKSFPPWEGFEKGWKMNQVQYKWTFGKIELRDPLSLIVKLFIGLGVQAVLFVGLIIMIFKRNFYIIPLGCLLPFLFYLITSTRKHVCYYFIEWFCYFYGVFLLIKFFIEKSMPKKQDWFLNFFAFYVCASFMFFYLKKELASNLIFVKTPMEIIRSNLKEIIGPNQKIGGQMHDWYITGGDIFYEITPDLSWTKQLKINLNNYLEQFDWISASWPMSNSSLEENGLTISSLIANTTIIPEIFVFFENAPSSSFVLCRPRGKSKTKNTGKIIFLWFDKKWDAQVRKAAKDGNSRLYGFLAKKGSSLTEKMFFTDSPGQGVILKDKPDFRINNAPFISLELNERYSNQKIFFLFQENPLNLKNKKDFDLLIEAKLGNAEKVSTVLGPFKNETNIKCLPRYSLKQENH